MDIVLMMGCVLSDGRMSARVKYDVNDRFSIKANAQVCSLTCVSLQNRSLRSTETMIKKYS
jgi:hypothetical protein